MDEIMKKWVWVDEINEESRNNGSSIADEKEKWKKRSIFKVPSQLKEQNKNAYKPQTISFGPYHHGEKNLMAMEEHKHRALIHFLKRCKKPIELLFQRLDQVVDELRDSYVPLDQIWKDDKLKFLQMMILDGCFLMEIAEAGTWNEYDYNDPVFGEIGKLNSMPYILRDMLILENQIPMTVLHTLFQIAKGDEADYGGLHFKFLFFFPLSSLSDQTYGKSMHLLDLFRKYAIQPRTELKRMPDVVRYREISASYRSAVELHEAGISFEKSGTRSLGDVSFNRAGVLRLPAIVLDESTEYIFHNYTAFERLYTGVSKDVTMYLLFMCSIINSAKDVSILCQSGILINAYGSYEDIAKLFNSLPKEIPVDYSLGFGLVRVNDLSKMRSEIDDFCKKPWNKSRANLTQTYFRSPWSMVSLVAAILLFALTFIQTGYSIAQFYQKPN